MLAKPQPTRFPRPLKTLVDSRISLNIEMEQELNRARLLGQPEIVQYFCDFCDPSEPCLECENRNRAELSHHGIPAGAGPDSLAQLLDPQGRRHIICRIWFAAKWCSENADWTFEAVS